MSKHRPKSLRGIPLSILNGKCIEVLTLRPDLQAVTNICGDYECDAPYEVESSSRQTIIVSFDKFVVEEAIEKRCDEYFDDETRTTNLCLRKMLELAIDEIRRMRNEC